MKKGGAKAGGKKGKKRGSVSSKGSALQESRLRSSRSSTKSPVSATSEMSRREQGAASDGDRLPSPVTTGLDNPAADLRNMRRIIAEDPEWTLAPVPQLVELCVHHIVNGFAHNSDILNKLPAKQRAKVLEKIPTDLPLRVTATLVDDDGYWRRCCTARWPVCDVAQHGGRWKRMFFERALQQIVESTVPETTDPAELYETLALAANYVRRLTVDQLLPPIREKSRSKNGDRGGADGGGGSDGEGAGSDVGDDAGPSIDHFDFTVVLPRLPFLEELHVTYGVKNCGMNFEWNLFQFTGRDCRQLAGCVSACRTLRVLRLHRSKVDDDKVRVLIANILDHPVLLELDLSNNIISDRGARAIGKFLNNHSQLRRLSVVDNNIRAAGAQAIAHALTKNTMLTALDLRLNHLGDDGGQAVCRALLKNATLVELGLGSNELTEPTAALLSQVIVQNRALRKIDLSCNRLGPDGGKQLQEGMEENRTLTHMDLRLTECGQEAEFCINQALNKNCEKEREQMRIKNNTKNG